MTCNKMQTDFHAQAIFNHNLQSQEEIAMIKSGKQSFITKRKHPTIKRNLLQCILPPVPDLNGTDYSQQKRCRMPLRCN